MRGKSPWSRWFLAAFVGGLLVGWLALGWGALPLSGARSLPSDLSAERRADYLALAADSFAADGDRVALATRLASWPAARLAEDAAALENQLSGRDPAAAGRVEAMVAALSVPAASAVTSTLPAAPAVAPSPAAATATAVELQSSPTPAPTPRGLAQTENFLVLGTDTRPELSDWRTDTIMVVAVDREAGQVGILSIPRDLYVPIPLPGHADNRINAVALIGEKNHYPGGGPAMVQRVVSDTLGIRTQHWILIKQDGLVRLVDALGGVTVALDCPLYERTPDPKNPNAYLNFSLPAGQVYLDGPTAKKFATYRYVQTDFGRVRRQQQLIWAIRNRALQGDIIARIPQLWAALGDTFTTDLGLVDIIKLATVGVRLQSKDIHAANIGPDLVSDYTTPEGWYVLVLRDPAALRSRLDGLFAAKPLSDVGKAGPSGCPTPPPGFKDLSETIPPPAARPTPTP